jgi:hypothetical protein
VATALGLVLAATSAVSAAAFPDRIDLPDGWLPEGVTSWHTTIWSGSRADGAIWRGDLRTGRGDVIFDGEDGLVAVGIDIDDHGRLWVAGGPTDRIRVYDAWTGDLLAEYTIASEFLNDVVVTEDAAYITDSGIQQLIVVPLGADGALPGPSAVEAMDLTGDLVYEAGFNVNGIVEARGWLILVQSNTGLLFRADPASGETLLIEGDYDASAGDGIEFQGNTLWVVRNAISTVAVLRLDPALTTATEVGTITDDGLDVPTTATIAAGSLWAVNARFTTPPGPDTDYWITRLPLPPND